MIHQLSPTDWQLGLDLLNPELLSSPDNGIKFFRHLANKQTAHLKSAHTCCNAEGLQGSSPEPSRTKTTLDILKFLFPFLSLFIP